MLKTDINNEILIKAVKKLQLRFPVAEIERATGYGKGSISNFLNNQKPVSDKFLQTFSEAFNIDLREFGYTNGLERIGEPSPAPTDSEELKDKYILSLENQIRLMQESIELTRGVRKPQKKE